MINRQVTKVLFENLYGFMEFFIVRKCEETFGEQYIYKFVCEIFYKFVIVFDYSLLGYFDQLTEIDCF
jgi:hypothetical protein